MRLEPGRQASPRDSIDVAFKDALTSLGAVGAYRFIKWGRKNFRRGGRLDEAASKRLAQALRYAWEIRSEEILAELVGEIGDAVVRGPFEGMRIGPAASWGDGGRLPKLIGAYEPQLFAAIEEMKSVRLDRVIDVGAAEGFYAVGAAMFLQTERVIAVDIDEVALSATRVNAELNGVGERIELRARMDAGDLCELVEPSSCSLVISDCEGFELELLSEQAIEALRSSYCIVECHDFLGRVVAEPLRQRFSATHDVEVIGSCAREPDPHPALRSLSSEERALAVHESCPVGMTWLFARPRGHG